MTSQLSANASRVQSYLQDRGFTFTIKEFSSSTRTAQDAAESIGCTVGQIAKSLVFRDKNGDRPVLVIASGANRVDIAKIRDKTGLQLVKADAQYVKERIGFAIGGVPPVAHTQPVRIILDVDLKQYAAIWAAAGTAHAVFKMTPDELEALTSGEWIDLAAHQCRKT